MPLPRETDSYDTYTDQLVYFAARLAANPLTAHLATEVDLVLADIDQAQVALRDSRRQEVRLRAARDHQDIQGDDQTKKFRRRLGGIATNSHFAVTRLFPKGVAHVVAPRGRPQIDRLRHLSQEIDSVLTSSQLAADPEHVDLTAVLQAGKASVQTAIDNLSPSIDAWENQSMLVARTLDTFNFRRADGVARLGTVIGALRGVLGGSVRDAYGYTQSSRTSSGPEDKGEDAGAGEGDPVPL